MKNLNMEWSDLWRLDGPIGRAKYLVLGLALFGIKFPLDKLIASAFFGRHWSLLDYFRQPASWGDLRQDKFYLTMVAAALPFIWAGMALTLRRVRSMGWGIGGAFVLFVPLIFFVPLVNLAFFAVLSVTPGKKLVRPLPIPPEMQQSAGVRKATPHIAGAAALMAMFLTLPLAIFWALFSTNVLGDYGFGLFIGVPFAIGMISVMLYGYRQPRTYRASMVVCCCAVVLVGIVLLCVAIEGAICLLMAAPLAFLLALAGGTFAYTVMQQTIWKPRTDKLMCVAVLGVPLMMIGENYVRPPAPLLSVHSEVLVHAPPEVVWRNVVNFSDLPAPREWLFRTGIAYPIRARILGRGVGAVRRCEFSTGPFVEPIQVWDEPRLLKFSVTSNPAPLEEWTPYHEIHPRHLSGFLVSECGQFYLTKNADGTTRLEGTTWYRHHMWPAGYWQIWSDFIIHRIHLRVLNHVKNLAEKENKT
jgi:hypothetical protein